MATPQVVAGGSVQAELISETASGQCVADNISAISHETNGIIASDGNFPRTGFVSEVDGSPTAWTCTDGGFVGTDSSAALGIHDAYIRFEACDPDNPESPVDEWGGRFRLFRFEIVETVAPPVAKRRSHMAF